MLRAQRPGAAPAAPRTEVTPEQPPVGNTPPVQAQASQAHAQQAQQASTAVAVPGSVQDLNAGILENIDGLGNSGNYVTVDGSEFLYKATDTRATSIDVQVSYGKRFYQWVDESNPQAKVFNNSDTKLNDNYKVKMEIRWLEEGAEEGDEPVEYTMSLSTTSAMQFFDFVSKLSKAGIGVGNVWSRMTISRHARKGSQDRYSRVDFEAFDLQTGQPLNIKSNS